MEFAQVSTIFIDIGKAKVCYFVWEHAWDGG